MQTMPGEFSQRGEQMMLRGFIIGAVVLVAWAGHAPARDSAAGEAAFRKCQPCHDVGEAAKNKLGPELNGIDGRKAGTGEGYSYSDSNKNSGIVWSETTFKHYLEDPQAKVPGTKIIFSDENEKEVADLWAYLRQSGADGKKKAQ
jgi:cytochrome c